MKSGVFESARGLVQVHRLTVAVDERMLAAGCDPFAPHVAEDLAGWPVEAWEDLAEDLGIAHPTEEEIRSVVQFYRNRARRGAA